METTHISQQTSPAMTSKQNGAPIMSADLTGKKFFIEYQAQDQNIRYAVARSQGVNRWEVAAGSLRLGHVQRDEDASTFTAYTPNARPEGIKCADTASAARQVVKDSGVATRILGSINLA